MINMKYFSAGGSNTVLPDIFMEDFMKTQSKHKFGAVVLALFMLLMSIPFSMLTMTTTASAAENTHVLEASKMAAAAAGAYKDGQEVKYDDFFTVYMSAKTKIDGSSKTWSEDGYASEQRINFGGKGDVKAMKNLISFKTASAATVKIWFVQGGDDNRQIAVWDANGAEAAATALSGMKKNSAYYAELKLDKAGTYLLGGATNNNYIFKVAVAEVPAVQKNVLEASKMAAAAAGAYKDGQEVKYDDFFTVYMSAKTKIDGSSKTWSEDGYASEQRINFGGKGDVKAMKNLISFKTASAATVKIWFVQGGDDNRQIAVWDANGAEAAATALSGMKKNSAYYAELKLDKAGTYLLGGATNNNYIFKVEVVSGGGEVVRGDWSKVSAPSIEKIALNAEDKGKIDVTVKGDISANGADKLSVTMFDADGKGVDVKNTVAEYTAHTLTFAPENSGKYTFTAKLIREGETDIIGNTKTFDFVYPLGKTTIISATSKGGGKVELAWQPVHEATGYKVYVDGKEAGSSADEKYTVSGLTVGNKYSFTVAAVRGTEVGQKSDAMTATATQNAMQTWGFIRYGTSTDDANNGYIGSINDDGKVVVYSENGKGKIMPTSNDGLSFYYTAIPTSQNFTLRANIHVDSWKFSNGQEGFGIMAADSVPAVASTEAFWTNDYMIAVSKMEYKWDEANKTVSDEGSKYTQRIGIGINRKIGVTSDNISAIVSGTDANLVSAICGSQIPLDISLATSGKPAGSYNMVGNETSGKTDTAGANLTDFDVEIQKNNTGYFLTYYKDGKVVKTQKFYDPNALSVLDKDNVYVGFFAARNARITVSNVSLTTIDPKDDKPAEEMQKDKVIPAIVVADGNVNANSSDYTLEVKPNVKGTVEVTVNGAAAKTFYVDNADFFTVEKIKVSDGKNDISVKFTPDAKQNLGADKELANTNPITTKFTVNYNNYFANQNNLYVSPNGSKYGNGGPEYPLDIYTAVAVAKPGQTIVITEGTYKLDKAVVIERGNDGTKDKMINMIADPNAKTKPVFDFRNKTISTAGLVVGGDYWYIQGFDVTNSTVLGVKISGNNNVLDKVDAYLNASTGIAIQASHNSNEAKAYWPKNNLVLNCTAYNNADKGYEDADGFSAKLTVGAGNVFDGCIAHHNADDGWDLYARVSTGSIESVTIQNCVAYKNGYLLDGTNAGNGNGFKLGGESLPGGHIIKNSIAFENKADGITSNSCPDVKVYNCTSYNNEKSNLNLYTKTTSANTDFEVKGLISYKGGAADAVKPQGTQDKSKYNDASNHYDGAGVTDTMFKTLKFKGEVARSADGKIDMDGYLELTDAAFKDAGARMVLTASRSFTITPDEILPNPSTGSAAIPATAAVLAAAGAAIFVFSGKRKK